MPVEANAFGKTEKKSMPDMAPRHFNQPGVQVAAGGAKKTEDLIQVRWFLAILREIERKAQSQLSWAPWQVLGASPIQNLMG